MSRCHSVLVTNTKGGCGKSTLSTNIASAFAAGGMATVLADVDRQQSSRRWLKLRPSEVAHGTGLDWRKDVGKLPPATDRLVIDVPAGVRMRHVDQLVDEADVVVVPVLPSVFDEHSTLRFLEKLGKIKPLRKGRKAVLVVANRMRARTKAGSRLLDVLDQHGHNPITIVHDRAIFGECANAGLGVFDQTGPRTRAARQDLMPLLNALENAAG